MLFHITIKALWNKAEGQKEKNKELSKFWKIAVIGLFVTTLTALGAAIGHFIVNIFRCSVLCGVNKIQRIF